MSISNTNGSHEPKIEEDEFPIHTMKRDLESLKKPESGASVVHDPLPKKSESGNPFLSEESWGRKSEPKAEKQAPKETGAPKNFERIIILSIIIVTVIALSAGAFFFFSSKSQSPREEPLPSQNAPAEEPQPSQSIEPQTNPPIQDQPLFSSATANYLSLDFQNSNPDAIKGKLQEYSQKVSEIKLAIPVEFIMTDAQNNPVPFSEFAKSMGIVLSSDTVSCLGKDFSLYVYNDSGAMHLGLAVKTTDSARLAKAMKSQESNLVKTFQPLFLSTNVYSSVDTAYGSSSYNGVNIRFINLAFNPNMSIDYSVYDDQLIIGTSKSTFRAIIDKIVAAQSANSGSGANGISEHPNSQSPSASSLLESIPAANTSQTTTKNPASNTASN